MWRAHELAADAGVLRHIHQAVQDPEECIAMCPVCSPEKVAAYRRVAKGEVPTVAYETVQKALDQRKQEQAARALQKASRVEERDDRKARQGKLL